MAYKFQLGTALMSGALDQQGSLAIVDDNGALRVSINKDTGAISGSNDLSVQGLFKMNDSAAGRLMVGNGTSMVSVALSADATLASGGALTIANDAITTAKIADDAITSALISDDAVVSAAIADDAITSALIADDAVVQAAIADDAVGADQLASDAVVNASVASNAAIDFSKLAALDDGNILVGNGSNVATKVAMTGDVGISNAGLTTIQADSVEGTMLNTNAADGSTLTLSADSLSVLKVPNALTSSTTAGFLGLTLGAGTAFDGAAAKTIRLQMALIPEVTGSGVDVAEDSFIFVDKDSGNTNSRVEIDDFIDAIAGGGLTATDGVLSTDAGSVTLVTGSGTFACSEGYNWYTGSANKTLALPTSPSVGDVVYVKAGALGANNKITVSCSVGNEHKIETSLSKIELESPYGAIGFVYLAANAWALI